MTTQIGAYYFPNYHIDPRNEAWFGEGWTEWELVRNARPRWQGHQQPKIPAWGYEDEADPVAFAKKIDAAADHGINHFIFDWYWYGSPYLERALNEGYLRAPNRERLQFALMWANHDWLDIFPLKRSQRDHPTTLLPGITDAAQFDAMTDHIVNDYFCAPTYWKIDGKPYFSIYELFRLVESFGGVEQTAELLQAFRRKVQAAGFPDLHLNAVVWGVQILPGEKTVANPKEMLARLGFDSVTTYAWLHHVDMQSFPVTPYSEGLRQMKQFWGEASDKYGLPYHPNVSMGWDASPRTVQSDVYDRAGYPFTPTFGENTPDAFAQALQDAKAFLDGQPEDQRILVLNAWNEWTESSTLEPDTVHGMAYLEAIRRVFGG
jgi:hypothetical protein